MLKKKQPSVNPNMLETGVWYSITIAPDDLKQHMHEPHGRLLKMYKQYRKWCRKLDMLGIEVHMYAELSCGLSTGKYERYHFHGRIRFKTVRGLFEWYDNIHIGILKNHMIEVDSIDDIELWDKYCTKNRKVMKQLHKHMGVSYAVFKSKDFAMVELE